jgi:hypothetical protein
MKDESMSNYEGFIAAFAKAPDNQLDKAGAKMCAEFDPEVEDPVRFIRDLRDLCVRYAWSSGFVIQALSAAIASEPEETEENARERRSALMAKWEPAP